jgi:tryptophan synthase beta chain
VPESAYSIGCAIDEALRCKQPGEAKAIAFNISGHGFVHIQGYREVLGFDRESTSEERRRTLLGI